MSAGLLGQRIRAKGSIPKRIGYPEVCNYLQAPA
jgi:hypothetical protein